MGGSCASAESGQGKGVDDTAKEKCLMTFCEPLLYTTLFIQQPVQNKTNSGKNIFLFIYPHVFPATMVLLQSSEKYLGALPVVQCLLLFFTLLHFRPSTQVHLTQMCVCLILTFGGVHLGQWLFWCTAETETRSGTKY